MRDGPTIDELVVGDEPAAWAAAGFTVDDNGVCRIGTVRVRLAGRSIGKGLRRWSLRDTADLPDEIDGVPTDTSDRPLAEPTVHANGSRLIDHLVWMSPDGDRTARAFGAATGLEIRRTRDDAETYGLPMRQQFFRLGEVVLELIAPQQPSDGPSRFFGLALTVDDVDGLPDLYGEHLGHVKDAVQPGRRIVTLHHKPLDLSVAIAFMSPGTAAA